MASTYLNKTFSGSGSLTTWTFSAWIKKCDDAATGTIFAAYTDGSNHDRIIINSNGTLSWYAYTSSSYVGNKNTNRVFRDTSAWYNIVCQWNTTSGTASERMRIWVNGVEETSFAGETNPGSSASSNFNNHNRQHIIGSAVGSLSGTAEYFNGYMSHAAFVDGQALAPTTFGETDSTSGIWKFKSPSGVTWGTNGFHLKFENSAALGTDSSGNTNTFTVNGNLRQAIDTPSNVYATFNLLSGADTMAVNTTFSNGNTSVVNSGSVYNPYGTTIGVNKGKWYAEFKTNVNPGDGMIGVFAKYGGSSNYLGSQTHQYTWYNASGGKFASNSSNLATSVGTYTTNDIIGIALDCDNNKLYYHKNGTYMTYGGGTMNPTSGTYGISITDPDDTDLGFYFMSAMDWGGSTRGNWSANFGNGFFGTTAITSAGSNGNGSLFEYDVPSGFYALNTKNINTYG